MPESSSTVQVLIRLAKVVEMTLADHGLTVNQFRALTFVEEGAPPLKEMSVRLVMKQPNVTAMIDGLVARGFLHRDRDEADRRRLVLRLTDEGRLALRDARAEAERVIRALARLGPGDAEARIRGLQRWESALDAAAEQLRQQD
jgi:DNA-binding MarR family transcriptional regulator